MKRKEKDRGSLTLEACIVVPAFVVIMMLVNGLFIFFMGQQVMTHTLVQSAKSLAHDPYAVNIASSDNSALNDMFNDLFSFAGGDHSSTVKWYDDETDRVPEIVEQRFLAFLKSNDSDAKALLDQFGIEGGADALDFSGSTYDKDTGFLTVKIKYKQEFIFNAADLASFDREMSIKVKVFE